MIRKELFGTTSSDEDVWAYTLENESKISVRILNLGGIIQKILVNDTDVVCGYDTPDAYLRAGGYQGALIGRCGNRIGNARFTLEGTEYLLHNNDGAHHLHGGKYGFDKKLWSVTEAGTEEEPTLLLTGVSPNGEEGYPGTLTVTVQYTLTASGALAIRYQAMTDQVTIVNLTNHTYFNLSGYEKGNIGTHSLWLAAESVTGVTDELIPNGSEISVAGTPYDFSVLKNIGEAINANEIGIRGQNGFDNNFLFSDYDGTCNLRAELFHPDSGRRMRVYTDRPCMQVYTANMIDENDPPFKGDVPQRKHCAICLETQAAPDSINHEGFTNVILHPGEVYDTQTIYEFL